jgi:isopentenyl phosphate kinase
MLVFVKLGGSVITDKMREEAPDLAMIGRLARELRDALAADSSLRVILGHGSGSFGHVYARRYGVHTGLAPDADWRGFALTAGAALRLNRFVVDALLEAGVPALALQPSATTFAEAGQLLEWRTANLSRALDRGLTPVVHGDVAFDSAQGSAIISTEQLLTFLAASPDLRPDRVVLVGEAGVYTADPRLDAAAERIPLIDTRNIDAVLAGTGGSHGVDVTGGMRSKVELMWRLASAPPHLAVQLIGPAPGLLTRALLGQAEGEGTTITV